MMEFTLVLVFGALGGTFTWALIVIAREMAKKPGE
jgi:hypothetical protein